MNDLFFLKGFWFNLIIFSLLGAALINCLIRYKKGQLAYRYYGIFFLGLSIIRIIQVAFLHRFPAKSMGGIILSIVIGIIFIFSIISCYFGLKKEKNK